MCSHSSLDQKSPSSRLNKQNMYTEDLYYCYHLPKELGYGV